MGRRVEVGSQAKERKVWLRCGECIEPEWVLDRDDKAAGHLLRKQLIKSFTQAEWWLQMGATFTISPSSSSVRSSSPRIPVSIMWPYSTTVKRRPRSWIAMNSSLSSPGGHCHAAGH